MQVKNIMTARVFCVDATQSLGDAAHLMYERNCGSAPVVDDKDHIVGMVTDRDITMAAYMNGGSLNSIPVSLAQSQPIVCCKSDDEISDVQHLMQMNQVHRIPVINDDGQPIGIVSLNDIACAYKSGVEGVDPQDIGDTLAAICSPKREFKGLSPVASA
ncbi:CBS domain-containing protein [Congregibacter variabilis]|uniref:CBS domain-containing protein n=1 Tax=Congregibacter variabilis TaxID=3081200 RepID=A0ABZ0I2V2_9GAMM|nr:CBS domain-containing protein [Congregibacter sp. IMCC43200]